MRVAAVQTTATSSPEGNLEAAAALVEEAAGTGAELVVLPEYFSVAGNRRHLRAHAEGLDGPTATWAAELAGRYRIWLLAGSFPEAPDPPSGSSQDAGASGADRLHNTSCLFDPDGSLAAVYRKAHLFDVDLAGTAVRESATIAPGNQLCAATLHRDGGAREPEPAGGWPHDGAPVLGLSICYDLRFPEVYRILALQGATIMAVPAAFTAATGPSHWELLLRARAVENEVFVIAAGQVGALPPGMPACHGHSMIVDPWGTVLAERSDPTPGVVVADLDPGEQRRIRAQLPVLANRRPDVYRWPDASPARSAR
jgi:deaminated glutathione amidase